MGWMCHGKLGGPQLAGLGNLTEVPVSGWTHSESADP